MQSFDISIPAYPSLKQTWGLSGITLLTALFVNVLLLGVNQLLAALGKSSWGQQFLSHSLTFLLTYIAIFVFIIWLGIRKKSRVERGFAPDFSLPSIVVLLMIAIGTLGIYFLVDPVVELIPMPKIVERLFLELLGDQDIWTVFAVVVAAPICEELLLRGIILDGLLKLYTPKKAIIWSALFFGFFHLNPWQFIPAVAIGIYIGWIYYRTRSLLLAMFIHFVANGTGALLGYVLLPEADQMVPTRDLFQNDTLYAGVLVLSAIVLTMSILYLDKKLKTETTETVR